jgi:DNA-directed RNA polymerase subunit RPC12/RpoP
MAKKLKEGAGQERTVRHQCKKCGYPWMGPTDEWECPKCHAREFSEALKAVHDDDHQGLAEALGRLMRSKVASRIAEEKRNVAAELLYPRIAEGRTGKCVGCGEKSLTLDDDGLCHECWQAKRDHEEGVNEGFIIVKSTRDSDKPYAGPACQKAGVPSGKVYASKEAAEADAEKIMEVNPVWFEVIKESAGWRGSTPADLGSMAVADDAYNERIKPGDRVRTKRGGQIPGIVTKVSNGNVHFDVDNPGGWTKTKPMVAPLSNVVKEDRPHWNTPVCSHCGAEIDKAGKATSEPADIYRRAKCPNCGAKQRASLVKEDTVSQHEVQRIYDEIGDVGETELLCGISGLRVNPQGQVISYICEAKETA